VLQSPKSVSGVYVSTDIGKTIVASMFTHNGVNYSKYHRTKDHWNALKVEKESLLKTEKDAEKVAFAKLLTIMMTIRAPEVLWTSTNCIDFVT
jgi:hypothetical protein